MPDFQSEIKMKYHQKYPTELNFKNPASINMPIVDNFPGYQQLWMSVFPQPPFD